MGGKLCAALLTLAASGAVQPVAGQNAATDRLAAARVQLNAMRFDSAAILLRGALDGSDHALPEDQAEALLLADSVFKNTSYGYIPPTER